MVPIDPPTPSSDQPLEAFYGLPPVVKFCRKCVISNQRPNSTVEFRHRRATRKETIAFDGAGVCDACRFAERKYNEVDWPLKEKELIELCNRHRRNDGRYDCIIPGSGGKDSFFQAHVLKYKYGMHPLTVTWAPHLYTDWGRNNHSAWINAGFDNYLVTPNGRVHRLLTRLAVENLFHPFQPFILGQKFLGPKLAAILDVPLVFYGENEAEYGNPLVDNSTAKRDYAYFTSSDQSQVFISGVSVQDLKEKFGLDSNDLAPYLPTEPDLLAEKHVEVHYLGYYLKWHPQACYYYAIENGGFQPSPHRTPGSYSKYNSIDDKVDDLHFWTYHVKFGIGRATYDAAQEIRSGDITREEGVALVKRFDGEWPARFEAELMDYLSINPTELRIAFEQFDDPIMTKDRFWKLADRFRSPHLWLKEDGVWRLRHTVWQAE